MDVEFLTVEDALLIHRDQVDRYGGDDGLRDIGLLESAVAAPRAMFAGRLLHENLFQIAAAYLFHIVRNHPFVDGNKRTGAAAALVFLDLNGVEIEVGDDDLVECVLAVAQGEREKAAVAEFLRRHAR